MACQRTYHRHIKKLFRHYLAITLCHPKGLKNFDKIWNLNFSNVKRSFKLCVIYIKWRLLQMVVPESLMASPYKNAPVYGIDFEFNVGPNHVHVWHLLLKHAQTKVYSAFFRCLQLSFSSSWDNHFKHGHCKDFLSLMFSTILLINKPKLMPKF